MDGQVTSARGVTPPGETRAVVDPRRWTLWQESWAAVIYILGFVGVSAGLAIGLGLRTQVTITDLAVFVVILACAAVAVETTRRLGEPSGISRDLLFAWALPAALLLPPVYAFLLQLPLGVLIHFRVKHTVLHRRVFTMSAKGLAGMVGSLAFHLSLPQGLRFGSGAWLQHLDAIVPLALGSGLLCILLNELLVGAVIHLVAPQGRPHKMLWSREALSNDLVELCVGAILAFCGAVTLVLFLVAVPPVVLLQRSLMHAQLREAARTDGKTGLLNAGTWQREGEKEVTRATRAEEPLALLIIDIDHFKRVNDQHGHLTGDEVLLGVAKRLGGELRDYDLLGRFGGEEFVILLPETDEAQACRVGERLCTQLREAVVETEKGPITVTISIGVALLRTHGEDLTQLISAADAALYHAKATGRDRVCLPAGGGVAGGKAGVDGNGIVQVVVGADSVRDGERTDGSCQDAGDGHGGSDERDAALSDVRQGNSAAGDREANGQAHLRGATRD